MNTKSSTKSFLYRTLAIFMIVMLAFAALPVSSAYAAAGDVAVLQAWPDTPTASGTTSPVDTTFTVSAGSNRLMLVAVDFGTDNNPEGDIIVAAVYGNKALTKIQQSANLPLRPRSVWLGYLKEADIAAADNTNLQVTVTGMPSLGSGANNGINVYVSTYTDVNQTTPVTASSANNTANTKTITYGAALAADIGSMAVFSLIVDLNTAATMSEAGYSQTTLTQIGSSGNYSYQGAKAYTSASTTNPTFTWATYQKKDVVGATLNKLNPSTRTLTYTAGAHGSITGTSPQTVNYGANGTAVTAVPATGYQFVNWSDTSTANPRTDTNVLANVSVTANFAAVSQTLTFNSNGGSAVGPIIQDFGTLVSAPTDPTKTGYSFAGWYSNAGLTTPYTFPHTMGLSTTIHAKWTAVSQTLTFNSNGGSAVAPITQNFDTAVSAPSDPTKTGYTFAGWYSDDVTFLNAYAFPHTMGLSTTIHAKWTTVSQTLTFNSNGGSAIAPIIQDFGTSVSAPTDPTKTGYAFAGWYSDDVTFLNTYTFPHTMGLSTTIYAKWAAGGDKIGTFRSSNATFYLRNTNSAGAPDITVQFGAPGDYPVVGDWDGNGTDTIGVYRNGVFYLSNSNTTPSVDLTFAFGKAGDQPIAGDWNGDGTDTIGVYRSSAITFLLRNSNSAGAADTTFKLGSAGDVGITGDWNGDGMDTTGVFRPSNGALYLKNTNTSGYADVRINYGTTGDKPVTGDWNYDTTATIGIYRNGIFYLRNSNTKGYADLKFAFGAVGDMPLAGNWDGIP